MSDDETLKHGTSITLGGQTFLLSRTKPTDIKDALALASGELRKRPTPVSLVRDELAQFTADDRATILQAAVEQTRKMFQPESPEMQEIMNGLFGAAAMIWAHARHKHPGLSFDMVYQLAEQEDFIELNQRVNDLMEAVGLKDLIKNLQAQAAGEVTEVPAPGKTSSLK